MLVHLVRASRHRVVVEPARRRSVRARAMRRVRARLPAPGERQTSGAAYAAPDGRTAADHHHVPRRRRSSCAWPGSPRPTPPAGPASTTRTSTTCGSPSASCAASISGVPSGDGHPEVPGRGRASSTVEGHAAPGALVENEFSRMIVDAVVDELELSDRRRRHRVPVHEAARARQPEREMFGRETTATRAGACVAVGVPGGAGTVIGTPARRRSKPSIAEVFEPRCHRT